MKRPPKLFWKATPAPTGRYRSFEHRGWPTAYYGKNGKPAAFIYCPDSYEPSALEAGTHAPLRIHLCHHQHQNRGNSWAIVILARPAATLKEAKARVEAYVNNSPGLHPLE